MVFECQPAVKLHAKNVEVGTSANANPRQDKILSKFTLWYHYSLVNATNNAADKC